MTKELAIKILLGDVIGTLEQNKEAVEMGLRALIESPVQPGRWIPCSERLPEDCADVFITYVHDFALTCPPEIKKMFVGTDESGTLWEVPFADYIAFYDQEEKKWFMPSEDPQPFPDEIKVVAWMPLPEPYIEEKRENHEID